MSQFKVMRALAHPVRFQILQALAEQPACVCELQAKTGRRQAYISQQLSILRAAGLVCGEKEGLQVRYRLTQPEVIRLLEIVQAGAESLGSAKEPSNVLGTNRSVDIECSSPRRS